MTCRIRNWSDQRGRCNTCVATSLPFPRFTAYSEIAHIASNEIAANLPGSEHLLGVWIWQNSRDCTHTGGEEKGEDGEWEESHGVEAE